MNSLKITLRVPDDLKARMDAVEGVNWSAVAREAFEAELREIEMRMNLERLCEVVMASMLNKMESGHIVSRWEA